MALLEPSLATLAVAAATAASAALFVKDRARPPAERVAVGRKNLVEGIGVAAGALGLLVGLGALNAHPFLVPPPQPVSQIEGALTYLDVEPMGSDDTYSTKGPALFDCLLMVGTMRTPARFPGCPLSSVPDGYQGRPTRLTLAGDYVTSLSVGGLFEGTLTRPAPDAGAPSRHARRWLDAAALLAVAGLALRLGERRRLGR